MSAYVYHDSTTGEPRSMGTTQAPSVPTGQTEKVITDAEWDGLRTGAMQWQASTRTVITNPAVALQATYAANKDTITNALVSALATIDTIRAKAQPTFSNVSGAQTAMRTLDADFDAVLLSFKQAIRLVTETLDATT